MFDPKSRYADLESYQVTDHRGRRVAVVGVPLPPDQSYLGTHRARQGERLDHLAAGYLGDPAGFWRLCEQNGVMLAEALSEAREIEIPQAER